MGDGIYSFALETTSNTAISMDSRETSDKPELVIKTSDGMSQHGALTFTPEADAYANAKKPKKE